MDSALSALMGKRSWKGINTGKYEKNYTENNHTEGGYKVAFVIYNSMYGKQKPAVHR